MVRPLSSEPTESSAGPAEIEQHSIPVRDAVRAMVVVDRLGAGPGELVLVAHGSRCRDLTLGPTVATKEMVVAIVDRATAEL